MPRDRSIPTAETQVSGDELLTDPHMEFEAPLPALQITDVPTRPHDPIDLRESEPEDPTITGGLRFDTHGMPVVTVPEDEARRLADEGLVVDPHPKHEQPTAALDLPPGRAPTPAPAESPERTGTRSDRGSVRATGIDASEARTARPAPRDESVPGFVDASVIAAPPSLASYGSEISEPKSLPGEPAHEAAPFEVDEETFGPNEPMPEGTQLGFGVYRIDGLLGEGRVTRVYRATDMRTDSVVALKEFKEPGEALRAPSLRNMLERFRLGEPPPAVLSHEGSIALLDFLDDTTRGPVAVMEYVPAGDLESFLAHRGRPLSPREAATLFVRVCDTLTHALEHGVVHGDIQPRNILLTEDAHPKIDLVTPVLMGTPCSDPDADFAAPEVQGGRPAGPAADVYGLGASLYQAATDPRVAVEGGEAPRKLEPIIERCVEDDPAARYPTARELGDALRGVLDDRPRPTTGRRPISRAMQLGLALGAVALGLAIGAAVTASLPDDPPEDADVMHPVANAMLEDARAMAAEGRVLDAAAAYRRLVDTNPELEAARSAHDALVVTEEYKRALRQLRRRLRKASAEDARLRADLELLAVLAPNDALIDHWRSRLKQSNDKGAAGGPAE